MTKQEFREFYQNKLIYLDGATGSNLQKAGMPTGVCPEQWILEHPDAILELQRAFVEAGTNILYAPTFTANRIKLAEYGLAEHLIDMNTELVRLAKQAAGGKALVAGDITMTGRQLTPMGDMDFEQLIDVYKEQIRVLDQAGVDLLVVETMMSLQETRAALIAAKEVSSLPVIASLTFESDNKTLFGTDPMTAMLVLQALGADVVGTNCSTGPDQMCGVVRQMKQVAKIPVLAKPNAGLPKLDSEGRTVYEMDAETFGREMCLLVEAGATFLGGCCGTTVKHIRSMVEKTGAMKLPETTDAAQNKGIRYLTSERKTLAFGLDDRFHIVGERINPTGKKKFQACIRDNDFSMVEEFVTQQEESGASILDINMGMSGIDSSLVDVQEYVLRHYPGRALINSISMESAKMEALLQIAKKYGAMFILLPVSDEGLPKDLDEKKEIIQKILRRALELGFTKEDIVVDGLVATVGANKNAALETLETIRYCKEQGLATICGLSNISFGLPERSYINAAFLIMAIANGLTMAIANPNQELLTSCMLASDLLLHKQDADLSYIEVMNERKQRTAKTVEQEAPAAERSVLQKVYECVLKGNKTKIVDQVHEALKEHEAQQILNEALLPAINEVGDLFDKGIYFLPQLIASAEAMKTAIEDIQPLLLAASDGKPKATIVIATVEGDIHDIGKNLVALMLKNYGFRVIDLGKDVPKEVIIETAKKEHADIIALSALMTTTMQQMKHVIEYAKEQGVTAKVLIGGAVITQEYADEIGADGYSKDAAEAVKVAKQVLGLRD